jgi:hypothetical protein
MDICRYENRDVAGKFATLVWEMWNNRNNSVWNNVKEPGQTVGIKALCHWSEWKQVQTVRISRTVTVEQHQPQITQWHKPRQG